MISSKDMNPKLAKQLDETMEETNKQIKRLTEIERARKAEKLRKQGNISNMLKTMFGQEV